MADLEAYYRVHLKSELMRRKARNRLYSLRSFASFLKVDNAFLSRLLNGRALLSLDVAEQFSKRLGLEGNARAEFLMSAAEEQKCHALYLIDPSLTDCDPELDSSNRCPEPKTRSARNLTIAHCE